LKRGFITKEVDSYLKVLGQGRDHIAKQLDEDHQHWTKDVKEADSRFDHMYGTVQ
jgi:hypothetical protein